MTKPTQENYIPFYIISREIVVKEMIQRVEFVNETISLKYNHVCEVEKGVFAYFRSEEDAKMAARGNNWKFVK